jgi:hypothetical protein
MASVSDSGRSTSPTTSSTSPRHGLPCNREASRAKHRTRIPVSSSLGTSRPPMYPVTPVTSTGRSLDWELGEKFNLLIILDPLRMCCFQSFWAGVYTKIGKCTTAEFAKQVMHMPGIVRPFTPFAPDTFQMSKANDDFQFKCFHWIVAVRFSSLGRYFSRLRAILS